MAWLRIDDNVPHHRKMLKAGPSACWLWLCGLAYCQRFQTDGFIPFEVVDQLGILPRRGSHETPMKLASRLEEAGMWLRGARDETAMKLRGGTDDGRMKEGWHVHDFLQWNDSSDERKRKTLDKKKRHEKWLANKDASTNNGRDAAPPPPPTPTPTPPPRERARTPVASVIRPRDLSAFWEGPIFNVPQRWAEKTLKASNGKLSEDVLTSFCRDLSAKVARDQVDVASQPNFLGWLDQELREWRSGQVAARSDRALEASTDRHMAKVKAMLEGR